MLWKEGRSGRTTEVTQAASREKSGPSTTPRRQLGCCSESPLRRRRGGGGQSHRLDKTAGQVLRCRTFTLW